MEIKEKLVYTVGNHEFDTKDEAESYCKNIGNPYKLQSKMAHIHYMLNKLETAINVSYNALRSINKEEYSRIVYKYTRYKILKDIYELKSEQQEYIKELKETKKNYYESLKNLKIQEKS